MSTLDQFRFSFVFLGLPKWALIAIGAYLRLLLVASLLILGYDATASSNHKCSEILSTRVQEALVRDLMEYSRSQSLIMYTVVTG